MSHQEVLGRGLAAMLAEHEPRTVLTSDGDADVILYDVFGMHAVGGADLDELVQQTTAPIIVISRDLRPDLRARALAHGAHAWISMSAGSEDLVAAVEAAASGGVVPEPADRLGDGVGLTAREVEVLALVAQGCSNQEIADRLYLSINSVKTYIRSAYSKIGADSRTRAVIWCLQNGFAPLDS